MVQTTGSGLLSTQAPPLVSLLGNGELDTLAFWQRHLGLGTLTNDENVGQPDKTISTGRDVALKGRLTLWQRSCREHHGHAQCRNHPSASPCGQ